MDKYIATAFADMVANLLQNELCSDALLHGFMGIASEAGELLDKYKYMHNLDEIDTLVELSDLLHFAQMLMGQLDISLAAVVEDEQRMHWTDNLIEITVMGFDIRILQALAGLSGAAGELLNRYKNLYTITVSLLQEWR
jgi:phosphoribosyl-ATP pyrophosphohydrolase